MQNIFIDVLPPWVETGLQPAFYDLESGTVLQQTARMYAKVRELVDSYNQFTEDVTDTVNDYIERFNELYTYVHDYFDNLDVQEEINHKLDEMAEDGTLETLIAKVLDTDETYYFHTVMATPYYRNSDSMAGMQGGCMLPDGRIFQCIGYRSGITNGKMLIYAQDGTLINSADLDFGHCNSCCYCPDTETVFITGDNPTGDHTMEILEVNPSNLSIVATHDVSDFPLIPYGIAYDEVNKNFVFVNPWNLYGAELKMWKTDAEFNVLDTKTFNFKIRSTANLGKFGKYLGVCTISNTSIMLFDMKTLTYIKSVNINDLVSDTWYITEPEWLDTVDDVVYFGFIPHSATTPRNWGGGTKVYAKCDLKYNYEEIGLNNSECPPQQEVYYVNEDATYNPLRDGSLNKPFINIYEALNSALRTANVTGKVSIYIKNKTGTYAPLFSNNKQYYITQHFSSDASFTLFSNIFVNSTAHVVFYTPIVLQGNVKDSPLGIEDANIQNRGYLDANYISLSTDEKLTIASSTDSVTKMYIDNDGIDFTNASGEFYNKRDNKTFATTDLVVPTYYTERNYHNVSVVIEEADNKFILPIMNHAAVATVRYQVSAKGPLSLTNEFTMTIIKGVYASDTYNYIDGDDTVRRVVTTYDGDKTITITATGTTPTQKRVKYSSL